MPPLVKREIVLRIPDKAPFEQRLIFASTPAPNITPEEYEQRMQCPDRNRYHVLLARVKGPNAGDQIIEVREPLLRCLNTF